MKREPGNLAYRQMLEQLDSAHEQRKAAHEHLDRLEGKSEEERKIEIRGQLLQGCCRHPETGRQINR